MIRLNCVAEGQTELRFFNQTLRPHLAEKGVMASARCVTTARKRHRVYRGGIVPYRAFKNDVVRWLKEDQNADARFTTMIDLHRLPDDFPGYDDAAKQTDPYERVCVLEQRIQEDIGDRRLVPYVQLYEFEALLFSQPEELARVFVGHDRAIAELSKQASQFASPEHIDDGEKTAPSRRIIRLIPAYQHQKASAGPIIAAAIGLAVIRNKCSHFNEWVQRLETLDE